MVHGGENPDKAMQIYEGVKADAAKQAAEERRGSRFVRSCFSLAELERQVCHTGLEPRTSRLHARPALQPGLLLTRLSLALHR